MEQQMSDYCDAMEEKAEWDGDSDDDPDEIHRAERAYALYRRED